MFTQLVGTAAIVYGVLAALKHSCRHGRCSAAHIARSLGTLLGLLCCGYATRLAYGLSTGSLPLIIMDTVCLLCGGLTPAVALSLRGSHRARSTVMQGQ